MWTLGLVVALGLGAFPAPALGQKQLTAWSVLAPFPSGKLEPWVHGEALNATRPSQLSALPVPVWSELVPDGGVDWQTVRARGGSVVVEFPLVPWGSLVQSLGMEVLEWKGWAIGEFSLSARTTLTITCTGVSTFFLDDDDLPIAGNQYFGQQSLAHTVQLTAGRHTLTVPLQAKVKTQFSCSWSATPSPQLHASVVLKPDLVSGHVGTGLLSVAVRNAHPSEGVWVRVAEQQGASEVSVSVVGDEAGKGVLVQPSQVLPLRVQLARPSHLGPLACPYQLTLTLEGTYADSRKAAQPTAVSTTLECRSRGQSFVFTFLDHDGSVQHAAAVHPPSGKCESVACPVLLTLHGTSVAARDAADAYKFKKYANLDFVFGIQQGWLLAPSRHGAHNWEGVGQLHALSALEALCEMTANTPDQANCSRVLFAGHSMGGHGAWLLAGIRPDIALGANPNAGWIGKEFYGDSNTVLRHDASAPYVDPKLRSVLTASTAHDEADRLASNLAGMPILVRVGERDGTVSPFFSKRMVRTIREQRGVGADHVRYHEVKGQEHWWWDTEHPNDGGVVFDSEIQRFFKTNMGRKARPTAPATFRLTSLTPSSKVRKGGVAVLQHKLPYQTATVDVDRRDGKAGLVELHLTTQNAHRLQVAHRLDVGAIAVDGVTIHVPPERGADAVFELCSTEVEGWVLCAGKLETEQPQQRGPNSYGPMPQVLASPHVVVYGTTGTAEETSSLKQLAVFIANLAFMAGHAYVPVCADSDVECGEGSSINAILVGTARTNSALREVLQLTQADVSVTEAGGINVGGCEFARPGTGVLGLVPHHTTNHRLCLLVTGTDTEGVRQAALVARPTIPPMTRQPFTNALPDFVVLGAGADARLGLGGVQMAGFWDNAWRVAWESSFVGPGRCGATAGQSGPERLETKANPAREEL